MVASRLVYSSSIRNWLLRYACCVEMASQSTELIVLTRLHTRVRELLDIFAILLRHRTPTSRDSLSQAVG